MKSHRVKNNPSRNHHYLPQHYLQGFTNEEGIFFVYDKKTGKIFETSPKATFFQKNLNTISFPNGAESDLLEKMYTNFENSCWGVFDKIAKSNHTQMVSVEDKAELYLFLLFQYWRLPQNTVTVENLSGDSLPDDEKGVFNYFKLGSKKKSLDLKSIITEMRESSSWKKIFKTIIPFAPFYNRKKWVKPLLGWKFVYAGDYKNWYFVSDNPIITNGKNDKDPIKCLDNFIFPVSGKILLIGYEKFSKKELTREFILKYNTAVLERAKRFVAHRDKDFLLSILIMHNLYKAYGKENLIVEELFKDLEEISS